MFKSKQYRQQIANLQSKVTSLNCDLSVVRGYQQDLIVAKRAVSDELVRWRDEAASLSREVTRLRIDLSGANSETKKLKETIVELGDEIEDLEEELDAAEAGADCLIQRNLQLSNQVAQLTFRAMLQPQGVTAKEILLLQQVEGMGYSLRNVQVREHALVKERDALKAEVASLKQQRTALVKERDGLKAQSSTVASLNRHVSYLQQMNTALLAQRNNAERLSEKYRGDLKDALKHLGGIVGGFRGPGSYMPLSALHAASAYYQRVTAHQPSLVARAA